VLKKVCDGVHSLFANFSIHLFYRQADVERKIKMVDIRLFGKLRHFVKEPEAGHDNLMRIVPQPKESLEQLLARIGIPLDDIYTIFLNSRLLATRSQMAYRMGYQQVHENPLDWNLEVAVKAGDRIGVFGRDMAALVV
jgi:hypothetical protein